MLRWVYYFLYVVGLIAYAAPASAQRVYADDQKAASFLTAGVTFNSRASDGDTTTASVLSITLVGSANQILKFTGASKPLKDSPVIVMFKSTSTLDLGLLNKISIQKFIGETAVVNAVIKTSSALGNVLKNLLSGVVSAVIPAETNIASYDGVRLSVAAGLGTTVNIYEAFFITPPLVQDQNICRGEGFVLPINNLVPGSGYKYKWYNSLGDSLTMTTGNLSRDSISTSTSYYVEAIDSGIYPSARIKINVNLLPKITLPTVQLAN